MLTFKSFDIITAVVLLSAVSGTPILRLDSCSKLEVTFTCTVTKLHNGEANLQWVLNRSHMDLLLNRILYISSDEVGLEQSTLSELYHFNLTSQSPLTSTLTANTSDLRGATVACLDRIDSPEPAHMATIAVYEPTSPHNITMKITVDLEAPTTLDVYLYWKLNLVDALTNTSYVVTSIPELEHSVLTTTNTSIQLSLLYHQEYNVSVVASNCYSIGMSAPAEIHITWDDQCPIVPMVWANISFELEYKIGSQSPYSCLPRPLPDSMIRKCSSRDDWNPNPADRVCSYAGHTFDITTATDGQDSYGIIVISTTVAVLVFLVILTLMTVLFITVWLHRRKRDSRSEIQTEEQTQNEYTEVEYLQEYQDDNETGSLDHMEQNHYLTEGHSMFTLTEVSELQNPLYQNVADNHDPDASLNLDSLLIQLQVQVTPKWHQFGLAIGMPEDLLQQYSSYPADEHLIEVLDFWFKEHQNPTWRDVAKVLCDIELHELAEGIMNVYETGCLPVEVDADDSDSDDNILLPLPIPSNMLHQGH